MRNPNKNYDIIVVGAGAAGCLFSRNLARSGYSVCLFDKKDRNELSHDWWDNVEKNIFVEVNISPPKEDELFKGGELIICSPLNSVQLKIPLNRNLYQVDRRKFNTRLLKEAIDAGVDFFDKITIKGPIVDAKSDTIIGTSIYDSDPIKSKLVVDCSGYEGVIRSNIPFKTDFDKKIRREDRYITYREIREKKPSVSESHSLIFFGKHKGFSSIEFQQDKYVGFFEGHVDLPSVNYSPKEIVYDLIDRYKEKCGAEIVRGGYNVPVPARRALDSFAANGLIIIGDAACQTNPGAGVGIASSLYAADIASKVAINALEEDSTKLENLWPYNVEYHRSELNQRFSSTDISVKAFLTLWEEALEYLITNDLLDLSDIFSSGERAVILKKERYKPKISETSKILGHLAKFAEVDTNVERMKEICKEYPEDYNPDAFIMWREKINNCYLVRYDLDKQT
ncbi:MAG: NAD(P)/FAD-dependent oxidoreductase [Promethearchaeota archaeon]